MIRTSLLVAALAVSVIPASAQTSESSLFPHPPALTLELVPRGAPAPSFAPLPRLQEESEEDEVLKYIGVGLMVVGGINTLYGLSCVATAHSWGNYCWPYLTISVGIGFGGWVLYNRNR